MSINGATYGLNCPMSENKNLINGIFILIWDKIFCYEIWKCVSGATYGLNCPMGEIKKCDKWEI